MTTFSPPPRPFARSSPFDQGFTLIELMVTIALAAILLSVAVPSFSQLVAKMRVEGLANNLATDLQLARSEALQRRANVSLSTLGDGTGYTITTGTTTIKSVSFISGLTFTGGVTVTNAANLTSTSSYTSAQLRITTDALGRVQMCSPDRIFKGYAIC
jgi:type IV fimbrial biogenesis protein FimT